MTQIWKRKNCCTNVWTQVFLEDSAFELPPPLPPHRSFVLTTGLGFSAWRRCYIGASSQVCNASKVHPRCIKGASLAMQNFCVYPPRSDKKVKGVERLNVKTEGRKMAWAFNFLSLSVFSFCRASQTLNSLKSIMDSPSALHLVHVVRPWTPKPSRVAFPHLLRNNTWLVKRRGDKKGQIRRRKLIWMAGGVGKLFIKMAIFLKDGCLNGSHVVRGSAQSDCILSRRKRGDFVLCQLHIEPPSYLVNNLDNMQNLVTSSMTNLAIPSISHQLVTFCHILWWCTDGVTKICCQICH